MQKVAVVMVAGMGLACTRQRGAAQDGGGGLAANPVDSAASFMASPAQEHAVNVEILPAKVFVAQVKSTPDENEALTLVKNLRQVGVENAWIHRADLGPKGVWYRVTVGLWARRDVADARAAAMLEPPAVAALLPEVLPGEVRQVVLEVPRFSSMPPALLAALERTAARDAGMPQLSVTITLPPEPAQAFWAQDSTRSIEVLGSQGQPLERIPMPGSPKVVFAGNVAGDGTPELLVQSGPSDHRSLLYLVKKGVTYQTAASVPLLWDTPGEVVLGEAAFKQLDSDADLEWLWSGTKVTFSAGGVCNATPTALAWDLHTGLEARPMDDVLHAANGVAHTQGGSAEVRLFVKGTQDRAGDLALAAELAYLGGAPDDVEIYRDVVARAEAAGREGRWGVQLKALAGLLAARQEWRVGLAPRLHQLLPKVVAAAQARLSEGCERHPLLAGSAALRARQDPKEALTAAKKVVDLRGLTARELTALISAFEQGSPLHEDVAALMNVMAQVQPKVAQDAKAAVGNRRAGAPPAGVAVIPQAENAVTPGTLPPPESAEETP